MNLYTLVGQDPIIAVLFECKVVSVVSSHKIHTGGREDVHVSEFHCGFMWRSE